MDEDEMRSACAYGSWDEAGMKLGWSWDVSDRNRKLITLLMKRELDGDTSCQIAGRVEDGESA
jgi:hypothetical protein